MLLTGALSYFVVWSQTRPELDRAEAEEVKLREEFTTKHAKAVNLEVYKGQLKDIERSFGAPTVINSGVVVAREIELQDPFENMGAQMAKEVAAKTSDVAGDGTTTATLLAYGMVAEGMFRPKRLKMAKPAALAMAEASLIPLE